MRLTTRIACIIAGIAIGAGCTVGFAKVVWQSGFDQGADVSQCIIATFANAKDNPIKLDMTEPACKRAKAYESSPLWLLRRRNG